MSLEPTHPPVVSLGDPAERSGAASGVPRAPLASVSGARIDAELERALAGLATSDPDSIAYLKGRNSEVLVAHKLIELVMTSEDKPLRDAARAVLEGSTDTAVTNLVGIASLVRKLSKPGKRFQLEIAHPAKIADLLKPYRDEPLVADRLVQAVLTGAQGAAIAAQVLQGTAHRESHDSVKQAMRELLDPTNRFTSWPQHYPKLLLTIGQGTQDAELQALIVQAYQAQSGPFASSSAHQAAARALGGVATPDARALLLEGLKLLKQPWTMRKAVGEALREQLGKHEDAGLAQAILPLISGSLSQTAWIIAGEHHRSSFARRSAWFAMITGQRRELYTIRVQVGLALQDYSPKLSALVLSQALNGKYDSTKYPRCAFDAAVDARGVLQRLSSEVSPGSPRR